MFEKFTEKPIKAIMLGQEEARRLGHNFVGTEFMLLGLIGEGTNLASQVLQEHGVRLREARLAVEQTLGKGPGSARSYEPFSDEMKRAFERGWQEATALGSQTYEAEHILLGMIGRSDKNLGRVFDVLGVSQSDVEKEIRARSNQSKRE